MQFSPPHFEKFVPVWVCLGSAAMAITLFVALLIVLATTSRRREDSN